MTLKKNYCSVTKWPAILCSQFMNKISYKNSPAPPHRRGAGGSRTLQGTGKDPAALEVWTDLRKTKPLCGLKEVYNKSLIPGRQQTQQQPLRKAGATWQKRLLRKEPEFEVKKEYGQLRIKISVGKKKEKRQRFHQSSLTPLICIFQRQLTDTTWKRFDQVMYLQVSMVIST